MANTRLALAKGFSIAVVAVFVLVGGYVLVTAGRFSQSGLVLYLATLSFALTGARGIWTDDYRAAAVGGVGMVVVGVLQGALVVGLAVLLVVALVLGWSGRTRDRMT